MKRTLYIIAILVGLAALYYSLNKIFIPFTLEIVKSDLFLEESDDLGDMEPITNTMTQMAALHCNNRVIGKLGDKLSLEFPSSPDNVWDVGNSTYIVKSYVDINTPPEGPAHKPFACQIQFKGGDETDLKNWEILGVDI